MRSRLQIAVFALAAGISGFAQTSQAPAIKSEPSISKAIENVSNVSNDPQYQADRARAIDFYKKNRFMDALPIAQKLYAQDPQDMGVAEMYGFVLNASASQISDKNQAAEIRKRAREVLLHAQDLGDKSDSLVTMLDGIPPDGALNAGFSTKVEVDAAMRKGEAFFTSGELEKAIASYQQALLLDPKLYEAPLFIGDCYFKLKKYPESGEWFAKAIAINPDQETAYRYWGDALMADNKMLEARSKFIDAYIAAPYTRTSGFALTKWGNANHVQIGHPRIDSPNSVKADGPNKMNITIDASSLNANDGRSAWMMYDITKASWQGERFKKEFPNEKEYRHSSKEEASGLSLVADSVEQQMKDKKIKQLDPSLATLVKLKNDGLIEPFVLFAKADQGIAQDYYPYLKEHRDKLRKYMEDYVVPASQVAAQSK